MEKIKTETIVALATPPGKSGIGVVRLSGSLSSQIAKKILNKKSIKPRHAYYLPFYDTDKKILDYGIAILFKSPHSFTGEDVLELQAHGGPVILDCIIKTILSLGCRLAHPGEFSERAFLNEKIDLVQAEAIADLIDASSEQAAQSAISSLQGEFSNRIHQLVEVITELRIFVESAIDFPEEEIDFLSDNKVSSSLSKIIEKLESVKQSAKQGALLSEGMTIAIAGKPNVGKSTLLNSLAEKETAIVTDIPGTTRDLLKETINLDGMPLHIIDTAGLRESEDKVEQEGIRRAWGAIEHADKIIFVVDSAETKEVDPKKLWPEFFEKHQSRKPFVIVKNKIDLINEKPRIEQKDDYSIVHLSAKNQQGINELKEYLKDYMGYKTHAEGIFIARRRHLNALERAHQYLLSGKNQLEKNKAGELLAEDLRQAQLALSEITGEFTSDDLLGKIFESFCIGK